MPASMATICFTEPRSLSSETACSPGVRSAIVSGELPRGTPSTLTFAPDGSVRTCSWPAVEVDFGSSMYCETCAPAVIVIGIRRGAPSPRSSSECGPLFSDTVTGVTPRSTPSTNSLAPGGFEFMISVPSFVTGAGETRRRAAGTPMPASARTATAAAANAQRFRVSALAGVSNAEDTSRGASKSIGSRLVADGDHAGSVGGEESAAGVTGVGGGVGIDTGVGVAAAKAAFTAADTGAGACGVTAAVSACRLTIGAGVLRTAAGTRTDDGGRTEPDPVGIAIGDSSIGRSGSLIVTGLTAGRLAADWLNADWLNVGWLNAGWLTGGWLRTVLGSGIDT